MQTSLEEKFASLTEHPFRETFAINLCCIPHINLETELIIATEGELTVEIETVPYVIRQGEGIFVLPFETHSFESVSSKCRVILFNRSIAGAFHNFMQSKTPITRIFPVPQALMEYIGLACTEPCNHFAQIRAESIVAPLVAEITEHCTFQKKKCVRSDLVQSALAIINDQLLFEISLEKIASKIGCHPVTLSKSFRAAMGIGFSTYISLRRCYHAKALLENTEAGITEIALRAGFGSLRDFNRCFKRVFSLTPTEYRKNNLMI